MPALSHQAPASANLGDIHWCCDPLWICIFPIWLARPRKGHSACHYSIQSGGTQGSTLFQRFQTTGCGWSCVTVSTAIHTRRIPDQDCLHHSMACSLPDGFRSSRASVSPMSYLQYHADFPDRSSQLRVFLFDRFSFYYIALSIPLIAYCSLIHGIVFGERLEFLPLMFISSYSAIGVVGSWIGFSVVYLDS